MTNTQGTAAAGATPPVAPAAPQDAQAPQGTADTQGAAPAAQEPTQTADEGDFSLDDLLGITSDADPLFADDANHRGMKPLAHWMQHLPEEPRKHIANLRASYTRKTQEMAQLRQQLEAERAQVARDRALLTNSEFVRGLQEVAAQADEDIDVWTEEGMKKAMQRQLAAQFQEFLAPLQEQHQVQEQRAKADAFVAAHPDARDDQELRLAIARTLTEREEMSLEDAYWMERAKLQAAREQAAQHSQAEARKQQRQTLARTSTGSSTIATGKPSFKDANGRFDPHAAFAYHKQRALTR